MVGGSNNDYLRALVGSPARAGDSDNDLLRRWVKSETGDDAPPGASDNDLFRLLAADDAAPGDSDHDLLRKYSGDLFHPGDSINDMLRKLVNGPETEPPTLSKPAIDNLEFTPTSGSEGTVSFTVELGSNPANTRLQVYFSRDVTHLVSHGELLPSSGTFTGNFPNQFFNNGDFFYVRVRFILGNEKSQWSDIKAVDPDIPEVPLDVQIHFVSEDTKTIVLKWHPPSGNIYLPVPDFNVYRLNSSSPTDVALSWTNISQPPDEDGWFRYELDFDDPIPSGTYFAVSASNEIGEGERVVVQYVVIGGEDSPPATPPQLSIPFIDPPSAFFTPVTLTVPTSAAPGFETAKLEVQFINYPNSGEVSLPTPTELEWGAYSDGTVDVDPVDDAWTYSLPYNDAGDGDLVLFRVRLVVSEEVYGDWSIVDLTHGFGSWSA